MTKHRTGTREEWLAARTELLAREKELTRRSTKSMNRYFARKAGETTDLARSPDDLLALDQPPEGDCYTIVADTPFQAVVTCAIMNQTMHQNPKRARTVTSAFKAGSRTWLRRSLRHIPVAVVPCRVQ